MRNSIGYKSLNVQTITDLKKISMEDKSIEFLCGEMGSGKTFAVNKFFNNLNDECIYLSSINSELYNEKDLKDSKLIDATSIVDISYSQLSELMSGKKTIIYNFDELIVSSTSLFEQIKNYCLANGTLLLVDISSILMYFELLKDVTFPMVITLTINSRNSNIYNQIMDLKNKCKVPIEISYINYLKQNKLSELEFKDNFADCSGDISLRIPKSLHLKLLQESKIEDVSLNQYLLYVIAKRNNK